MVKKTKTINMKYTEPKDPKAKGENKKAMIGEISMAMRGIILLIGSKIGSVARCRNWTMALDGSGLTQLIRARISISQ